MVRSNHNNDKTKSSAAMNRSSEEALEAAVERPVEETERHPVTTTNDDDVGAEGVGDETTTNGADAQKKNNKNKKKKPLQVAIPADEKNKDDDDDELPMMKLDKSPRLKGYISIALASVINFKSAQLSTDPKANTVVSASETQQRYAQAVSMTSAIITGFLVLCHFLDRYSPPHIQQRFWKAAFGPKSKFELSVIVFLVVWWCVATIVQTSVRGIAGDGKEQYNLYYSTWVCCWTAIWTLERKCVDMYGWSTLRVFITSWPYRAPGWIAIWVSCFFTLFWYLDLFLNTTGLDDDGPGSIPETLQPFYQTIPRSQYQWLLFVAAVTLLPSTVFIFLEIFRETTSQDVEEAALFVKKGPLENILEGFVLLLLSIGWIPSVIVATTPGGFASLVGNAYFFTWATTVFVMETSLWYLHDFRGNVHKAVQEKQEEYKRHQQKVLRHSKAVAAQYGMPTTPTPMTTLNKNAHTNSLLLRQQKQQQQQQQQQAQLPITNAPSPLAFPTKTHYPFDDSPDRENTDDDDHPDTDIRFNSNHDGDDTVDFRGDRMHTPPRFSPTMMRMIMMNDNKEEDDDDSDSEVQRELKLKHTNSSEYYDTLNDMLE
jgi:hypothetical protein